MSVIWLLGKDPDRDEDWAEVELEKIGEERFRREHKCEFIAFDETLIDSIKLANMEARRSAQYLTGTLVCTISKR